MRLLDFLPAVDSTFHSGGFSAYKIARLASQSAGQFSTVLAVLIDEDPEFTETLRSYLPSATILDFPSYETQSHERANPERVAARMETLSAIASFRKHSSRDEANLPPTAGHAHKRGNPCVCIAPCALKANTLDLNNPSIDTRYCQHNQQDNLHRQPQSVVHKPEGSTGHQLVVVASAQAVLQPISLKYNLPGVTFQVGSEYDLPKVTEQLTSMLYSRVDAVRAKGEFAVRGGILDIHPIFTELPVRIEFFGKQIESIRYFTQNSQSVPYKPQNQERLALISETVSDTQNSDPNNSDTVNSDPESFSQKIYTPENLTLYPIADIPTETEQQQSLLHLMPENSIVVVIKHEQFLARAKQLTDNTAHNDVQNIVKYYTAEELRHFAEELEIEWVELSGFNTAESPVAPNPDLSGVFVMDYLRDLNTSGWTLAIASGSNVTQSNKKKVRDLLDEYDINWISSTDLRPCATGKVVIFDLYIKEGFAVPGIRFALFGEKELFGTITRRRRRPLRRHETKLSNVPIPGVKRAVDSRGTSQRATRSTEFEIGDYLIHAVHGIGKFMGTVWRAPTQSAEGKQGLSGQPAPEDNLRTQATQSETSNHNIAGKRSVPKKEYLVLEYAKGKLGIPDRLYIPTDQLSTITKYIGSATPNLSRIGGSDWALTKSRARKAAQNIAADLVKLYSGRATTKGHAFSPDTPFQQHFEQAFLYTETPDQIKAIAQVKADMENPKPMDRLISGDVGFGKTEIAMRAAFKAVQDNKQVAVLAPTTLLVQQHTQRFRERFESWPVTIDFLSRFNPDAQKTINGVAAGSIDIVIGTHALLGAGVQFKDLGLLIIDEEQRFGVGHKEALKKLALGIDVLTMTATPIPRTLEMSLMGIKDMSTLLTPPENRMPILTHVGPYQTEHVVAGIRRELARGGQVFYVHNNTASISEVARHLGGLVPEARIISAHAKLTERVLEKTVLDFWEGKYDVLVCTTIIETGLDNANANTIIIDSAEKYGLSQLHQLRGRVGRGNERAWAYFFYSIGDDITDVAYKRLETIARENWLGAGSQIAMRDLELRGTGSLLGHAQSGHIAQVGFALYIQMISDAISGFKTGTMPKENPDF